MFVEKFLTLKEISVFIKYKKMKKQILKGSIYATIFYFFFFIVPISVFAYGLTTYEATNITDTGVTFNGSFSLEVKDKEVPTWFEFSFHHYVDDQHGREATDKENRSANKNEQVYFSKTFNGLFPNTHYWYRACIKHSGEKCQQNYNKEFRTLPVVTIPVVTTKNASNVTGASAKLIGSWTSNGFSTYAWFQYGTDPSLTSNTSTAILQYNVGSGSINQVVNSLKLNTVYYFRIVTQNKAGTSYGQINNFKTLNTISPPYIIFDENATPSIAEVTTCGTRGMDKILPVICNGSKTDNISDIRATLRGTALPDVTPTTVYFRYTDTKIPPVFCNDIYGSDMISTQDRNLTVGGGQQAFYQEIDNLQENTKYYYCAVVSDKNQITYGQVKDFTTLPCQTCEQITITTLDATVGSQTSAYLKGSYSSTKKIKTYFEYKRDMPSGINVEKSGSTKDLWTKINSSEQIQNTNSYGNVSFLLSELSAGTKYKFRLIAEQIGEPKEIKYGENLSFTTKTSNNGSGLEFNPDTNQNVINENTINEGGVSNQITTENFGTTFGTNGATPTLGQLATPPSDAIVRYHEGIETVLVRQIMANPDLARRYGYVEGANLETFAWYLADLFARVFGYVANNGKEIRVVVPDMAAYQILFVGNKLTIYEYFNNKIVNIQSMTENLRNTYEYEYYFRK